MPVRLAKQDDIPRIMDLLNQVLQVHETLRPDVFVHGVPKYSAEEVSSIIENPNTPVFVYEDDGGTVSGYAFCVKENPPARPHLRKTKTLFIDDLCVDESCRGTNIGTALYAYVRAYAKKEGFDRITLNVWNANTEAFRFYTKNGLKPLETVMEDRLD